MSSPPTSRNPLTLGICLIALFIVFTPFESPGSPLSALLPRFAVIAAVCLAAPSVFLQGYRTIRPAFVLLLTMLIHLTVLSPTEGFRLLAEWLGLLGCVAFSRLANVRFQEFLGAVRILIGLNVLALLVQIVVSTSQGELFDLHRLIFPMSQNRAGFESLGVIRYGGFHLEPGTYSNWMAMLLVMSRLLAGRFSFLEWGALISILLTYSVAGMVYVGIFCLWIVLDRTLRKESGSVGFALSFLIVCVALGFAIGADEYIVRRFIEQPDEETFRDVAMLEYMSLSWLDWAVGIGHTRELCDDCSFDDLGFLPNMLLRGGLFSLLGVVFLVVGLIRLLGLKNTLFTLVVIGTAKAATNNPAPWVALLVASEIGIARMVGRIRRSAATTGGA